MDKVQYKIEEVDSTFKVYRRRRRNWLDDFKVWVEWETFSSEKEAVLFIRKKLKEIKVI